MASLIHVLQMEMSGELDSLLRGNPMSITSDIHSIAVALESIAVSQASIAKSAAEEATAAASIAANVQKLTDAWLGKVVGLDVVFAPPTIRPNPEESQMASIKCIKKSAARMSSAAPGGSKPKAAPGVFVLQDNQDDTFTIMGVDAGGNQVDISTVATVSALSSDTPSVLTVSPAVGMTSACQAVGPTGSANILATVTWNDGSIGPFSLTQPVTVSGTAATGLVINFGTPTIA